MTAGTVAFALGGALLFVVSLIYGGWRYVTDFSGPVPIAHPVTAALLDIALFSIFACHHSLFARAGMKAWLVRHVPPTLERSVYVWVASTLFILVCALWRPVGGVAWTAPWPWSLPLFGLQITGLVITAVASRQLDVFDLAGLRQALGGARQAQPLVTSGWYRVVRHPIYFAWVLLVWATPEMTGSRLVFAMTSTAYLAVAIPFEERGLVRQFGDAYADYARRVRSRMVPFVY